MLTHDLAPEQSNWLQDKNFCIQLEKPYSINQYLCRQFSRCNGHLCSLQPNVSFFLFPFKPILHFSNVRLPKRMSGNSGKVYIKLVIKANGISLFFYGRYY